MAQVKDLLVQGQAKFLRKAYFQDQIVSNVAQGTAPLVVASSTVVSNLNSDYLDGYHASGLFTALSANSTLSITIGGTTLTSSINAATVDGKYISNYYTKSEADDRFVNVTGDTMRGNLILKNSKLWVQSENPYSGETNRMSMIEGHPDFLPFSDSNSSNKVGLCLYANAIAIRDTLYRNKNANDSCWIRFIESTNNSGYMEIGTGDDGTEPIYFRGYNTSSEIAWESYVSSGHFYSPGFHHTSQNSNNYILLAGGSYKAISDFSLSGHSHTFKLGSTTITTNGTQYSSITGPFAVNTGDSSSNAFSIQRSSSYEGVRHWVDDSYYHIDYTNDETYSAISLRIINTDSESPHNPSQATDTTVYLDCYKQFYPSINNTGSIGTSSYKWANMYSTTFHGNLNGVATYATHLNASYLYSSSSWIWNPFGFDNQYWCWGESFRNNSISADTGDIRFYITGVTSNGVTGQTICSMNIDGGIASGYKIYARDGFIHGGISSNANSYVLLAGGSYTLLNFVSKSGDTMTGALTIKGVTDSGQYSQGGFNKSYANIILQGDNTYGVSGIVFKSMKANDTDINTPSDVAFIQYHPYGVTAAAYNTTPIEASSGEKSRLVIGIGNDTGAEYGEELWLQTAGTTDLKHYVVNTGYTIWDAGNDGSGSGLDADLLDGYHLSNLYWANIQVQTGSSSSKTPTFQSAYINGPLYVGYGGNSPWGSWNEGIRLYGTSSSGSWSKIDFGCAKDSINSSHSNQWSLGRNRSNKFFLGHGADSENAVVIADTNNYIGINTNSPSARFHVNGDVVVSNNTLWVQSSTSYGGTSNRFSLASGNPAGLPYTESNTGKVGLMLYSNAIAIRDPYWTSGTYPNDSCWIRHIEETNNQGIMEIAVGDDGTNESIYFRGYNTSSTVEWEAYISNARFYANGLYHTSYGSSAYALTSDGGAAHIGSMSVNYANSAGTLNGMSRNGSTNWSTSGLYMIMGMSDSWGGDCLWLTNRTGQMSFEVDGCFYQRRDSGGSWRCLDQGDLSSLYTISSTTSSSVTSLATGSYSSIHISTGSGGTMSFSSTPAYGKECHIIIYNSGSSTITITLPSGYRRNISSISIASGAFGEVNVLNAAGTIYVRAV